MYYLHSSCVNHKLVVVYGIWLLYALVYKDSSNLTYKSCMCMSACNMLTDFFLFFTICTYVIGKLLLHFQAAVSISQGVTRHHLELLIGSHVLPYNMTVYQAVKQFSDPAGSAADCDNTDAHCEHVFDDSPVWHRTHTIL